MVCYAWHAVVGQRQMLAVRRTPLRDILTADSGQLGPLLCHPWRTGPTLITRARCRPQPVMFCAYVFSHVTGGGDR